MCPGRYVPRAPNSGPGVSRRSWETFCARGIEDMSKIQIMYVYLSSFRRKALEFSCYFSSMLLSSQVHMTQQTSWPSRYATITHLNLKCDFALETAFIMLQNSFHFFLDKLVNLLWGSADEGAWFEQAVEFSQDWGEIRISSDPFN